MQHTINIAAGQRLRMEVQGAYVAILSISGSASIGVEILRGNEALEEIRTMTRGMSIKSVPFDAVEFFSAAACVAEVIIGSGRVDVQSVDGATVNVVAATPLPVSNDRGAPAMPVYVSGLTYTDAPATALVEPAAVAVSAALTALVAADAARKAVRFTNLDAVNPVAIGGASLTWARRCIVLQPGDTWVEERGANLAWSAICNTALTASVSIQSVQA